MNHAQESLPTPESINLEQAITEAIRFALTSSEKYDTIYDALITGALRNYVRESILWAVQCIRSENGYEKLELHLQVSETDSEELKREVEAHANAYYEWVRSRADCYAQKLVFEGRLRELMYSESEPPELR